MKEIDSIRITVIDRHHKAHPLEVPLDIPLSLMEVCKSYELPVEGTCGGMALCASCHVYINSDTKIPEQNEDEIAMLDQVFYVRHNSRLGCQIRMSADIDGLQCTLAPEQV